jgi:hypothetical protein
MPSARIVVDISQLAQLGGTDSGLGELVGTIVWLMANVMYVQYRKDDLRGFKRFAAFWLGFPFTIFSAFGVRGPTAERRRQLAQEARDDSEIEAELLADIRRDRESRELETGDESGSEIGSKS